MLRLISIAFVALLCVSEEVHAQQNDDIVYLKNGSIIKGVIVEQIPGESVKLETRDGNLFVFSMEEIDRITKGPMVAFNRYSGQRIRVTHQNNRVTGSVIRVDPEGFELDRGGVSGIQRFNYNEVTRLERSAGKQSNIGKGYLIGAGLGTAAVFLTFADEDWGKGDWIGYTILGQLVGGLPGAMAGRVFKSETWENLPVSQFRGISYVPFLDFRYGQGNARSVVLGAQVRF